MSGKSNYFQTEFTISVSKKGDKRDIVLLTDDEDHASSDDEFNPPSLTDKPASLKHERLSPSYLEDPGAGPPSMASSSASYRGLEWDSGADVGYKDPNTSIKEEHMSTVERLARVHSSNVTRSEPEGTNHEDPTPPPQPVDSFCGPPDATSTPMVPPERPLSPEIVVQNFGGISDSDFDDINPGSIDLTPRLPTVKSSSLDNNARRKTNQLITSTYPRCSNASVPQPPSAPAPSTSSSSSVTVVKRQPDSVNLPRKDSAQPLGTDPSENDSPQSSGLDRANSFEYLPGRAYEEEAKDGDTLFQKDLDRGVELLAEFLKNVNVDGAKCKKKLIKDVVECLLAKNYPGDSDLTGSDEPRCEEPAEDESSKPNEISGTSTSVSSSRHESSNSTNKDTTSPPPVESRKMSSQSKKLSPDVLRYIRSEKEKQLNWIKTEINHLQNLKELLEKHETLKKSFNHYKRQKIKDYREKLREKIRENDGKARAEQKKDSKSDVEHNFSESTWNSHCHKLGGQLKRNASTNTTIGRCPTTITTISRPPPPPKSVAYTITFDRPSTRTRWTRQHDEDVFIAERDHLIASSREHVRTVHAPAPPPLQTELLTKNPQVVAKAEFRRRAVAELAALRELRVENKERILSAALTGEPVDPILTNPLKYRRAVSNSSMKRLTQKHYRKSTEVQKRKLDAKKKEEKQTNRLMAQIFNTKLQKKVLRGETHLPNTVNVITC